MSLLPKVPKPRAPKDLRPISLSSAMPKLYCYLLLKRTRACILPQGSAQCAHSGRQTADYLLQRVQMVAIGIRVAPRGLMAAYGRQNLQPITAQQSAKRGIRILAAGQPHRDPDPLWGATAVRQTQ